MIITIICQNRPCKIVEMSTSKTGKHGHAKVHLVALDIFTGENSSSSSSLVFQNFLCRQEAWGYLSLHTQHGSPQCEAQGLPADRPRRRLPLPHGRQRRHQGWPQVPRGRYRWWDQERHREGNWYFGELALRLLWQDMTNIPPPRSLASLPVVKSVWLPPRSTPPLTSKKSNVCFSLCKISRFLNLRISNFRQRFD